MDGRIGRFRLLEKIGAGGMADVHRAHDPRLDAEVALKVLKPELASQPAMRERFVREAMSARHVRSEHVIEVHELEIDADPPFFVMPLLEGRGLDAHLRARGALPLDEVQEILRQLLRGLAAAHAQGVIHRDVKPSNVFLEARPGEPPRVRLLDFGVALDERRDERLTRAGLAVGTPRYMAPEVRLGMKGNDRPAVDVYAVGMVAYEMITGEALEPRIDQKPPRLDRTPQGASAGVSASLAAVIDRALEPDASRRFASASALLEALEASHVLDPDGLLPDELVDSRYRVFEKLGSGGMAVVYRVLDTRLGEEAALKVLWPVEGEPDEPVEVQRGRFQDECEVLMRLAHPSIVRVRGFGRTRGLSYCVLDRVSGRTIAERAATLEWAELVRALRDVASALDAAHRVGVVHRDVKAENIVLREHGGAVLIDFGVARLGPSWRTRTGYVVGTPGSLAPEQIRHDELTARTDQWALAAMVYRLLAGCPPGAPSAELPTEELRIQLVENVGADAIAPIERLRPDLPRAAAAAITKALSPSPAERFASVTEFVDALDRASRGGLALSSRAFPREAPTRPSSRRRRPFGRRVAPFATTAVLLVGLAGAGALLLRWSGARAHRDPFESTDAPAPAPTAPASTRAAIAPADELPVALATPTGPLVAPAPPPAKAESAPRPPTRATPAAETERAPRDPAPAPTVEAPSPSRRARRSPDWNTTTSPEPLDPSRANPASAYDEAMAEARRQMEAAQRQIEAAQRQIDETQREAFQTMPGMGGF
jgi:serine/threonine protein kinase